MNELSASIVKQRGKIVALFVVCGFIVCLIHPQAIASVFASLAVPVATLAGVGEWAAKDDMQGSTK
jgi:hypothetical protein